MIQIHTTKNKRTIRASFKESIQDALTIHQDIKIPDEPIVIDKYLLKEIRDAFDNEAANGNTYCGELSDKLDNLYPFLNDTRRNNQKTRKTPG